MPSSIDISPRSILIAKMKALEAQFMQPLYNEKAVELRKQTEIALGDVYLELMGKEIIPLPQKIWKTKNSIIREKDQARSETAKILEDFF